jgi:hypothetical protein
MHGLNTHAWVKYTCMGYIHMHGLYTHAWVIYTCMGMEAYCNHIRMRTDACVHKQCTHTCVYKHNHLTISAIVQKEKSAHAYTKFRTCICTKHTRTLHTNIGTMLHTYIHTHIHAHTVICGFRCIGQACRWGQVHHCWDKLPPVCLHKQRLAGATVCVHWPCHHLLLFIIFLHVKKQHSAHATNHIWESWIAMLH